MLSSPQRGGGGGAATGRVAARRAQGGGAARYGVAPGDASPGGGRAGSSEDESPGEGANSVQLSLRGEGEVGALALADVPLSMKPGCCCLAPCLPDHVLAQPLGTGGSILLWGRLGQTFPRTCLLGPDWLCSCITLCLILVPSLLFLVAVPFRLGPATGLLCCFNTAATVWAYMLAAYSDPGIQVKQARLEEPAPLDGLVPCSRCSIYRSPHTVHCLMCDVCIAGLDHHCPWVGKCIGASTLRYFYIWLVLVALQLILIFVVTAIAVQHNAFR